jgi:type IV pilus assembly protein PilC
MPLFAYKAKLADGSVLEGVLEAIEQRSAVERLKAQKLSIITIAEKTPSPLDVITQFFKKRGSIGTKDITIFSRQLSTLVSAGVPIVQGLSILESQAENPAFKEVLGVVRSDIESGMTISEALKKHPSAFSDLYCAMVKAGELGGILDSILERVTGYLENSEALKHKVKGAMMYPVIVLTICGAVTIFLFIFVVPTFKKIFDSFGAELPVPTAVVIWISEHLTKYWYLVFGMPIALFQGVKKFYATPKGRFVLDGFLLKAPIFGPMLKKVAVAKFTRTLGTLVKSGVPILQALETVAQTAGNSVVERAVLSTRESIREGGRLADPMKKSGIFPTMVTSMISVGEETGNLDAMLNKIADFYDEEVDAAVKGLTSLIEPLVICVMGVVIGGLVVAMFLPMLSLGELASKAN